MADIKISELTTASQINNGDNIELSQDSGGGSLVSLKATILAVATKILKGINFTSDLQTTDKTIIGAINEAAQGGGGGSSSLAGLSDVDIDDQTLVDDQVLVWDSVNEKWVNADQSGQGGTTVVANPSGTPTDDLETIQIGNTIYNIQGGSLELSGKSLIMKTKTWTGTGGNSVSVEMDEKPLYVLSIYGPGLNRTKCLSTGFSWGDTSCVFLAYMQSGNGVLYDNLSYSADEMTITISGVDAGASFNADGAEYTMWYLVEETFNEFKDITGTLEAGETTITLSDADITSNSTVQPFTDVFGLNPTNMVVANGSVTLTFDAQQDDVRVKVRISSNCAVPVTNLDAEDIQFDSTGTSFTGTDVQEVLEEVADMLDVQQSYTIPTTPTDYGSFTFTRCGNLVQIEIFGAKVSSAQTYIEITSSLPSQFRPSKITYLTFTDNASTPSILALLIYPSGLVRMYGYATTAKTYNIQDAKTYFV